MQEKVAALKQALAANQAALKPYTWTESTEISLKGEVKKRQQKLCRYGPDGKVQKTALQGDSHNRNRSSRADAGVGASRKLLSRRKWTTSKTTWSVSGRS